MSRRFTWLALLSLLVGAATGTLVYVRRHTPGIPSGLPASSPSLLAARYHALLSREALTYISQWHDGPTAGMGYYGTGSSSEQDIRLNCGLALALSVLASRTHPPEPAANIGLGAGSHTGILMHRAGAGAALAAAPMPPPSLETLASSPALTRAVSLIRFLTAAHRAGNGAATDGGRWGGTDAAAVDAAALGMAAYLLRPALDGPTRSAAADVVRFEAERYLLSSPAAGAAGDSAAIPNSAAASVLCVAGNLYTTGGTRSAYLRRASTFLSRVLTTYYDVDQGKAAAPTLFPDLTLQVGGGFSSSAELQVLDTLARCALSYRLSGEPAPAGLTQHVTDCWRRVLTRLAVSDGWFLTPEGGVTSGGAAVSWLATDFDDPAAQEIDADAVQRLFRWPSLRGIDAPTTLLLPRAGDLAYRVLLYDYFSPSRGPSLSLTDRTLAHSLAGVTWFHSASFAVNRTDRGCVAFSWLSGRGQQWDLVSGQHVNWKLAPGPVGQGPPESAGEAPAWSVHQSSFSTMGSLHLAGGQLIQAGIISLPDGRVVLMERAPQGGEPAAIALSQEAARQEPDLFRDDEGDAAAANVRWADLDDTLGILILDGGLSSIAPPGISPSDRPRESWPILTVSPGEDHTALVVLAPELNWRQARSAADESSVLRFPGPGWTGALLPPDRLGEPLVIGRFGGDTSTVTTLGSPLGAPVTEEEDAVAGSLSTLALSAPEGGTKIEAITCWLEVEGGASVTAHAGADAGAAVITNPGEETARVQARFLPTGRAIRLVEEDGRTIFRLPARRDQREVHFYLGPGRTVTLSY